MNVLGIETSCDETAAAVIRNGRSILSNVVASSLSEHRKHGGIIPEIASRRQLEFINSVVAKSLSDAKLKLKDIDGLAVTREPGLIGSLLVGITYARSLSFAINKPLVDVDHIKAHLYANFLKDKGAGKSGPAPKLPAIGLVVSGGHTSLFWIKDLISYKLLGQTRDDAAGEAYDKVARLLGLGYPGGPIIDKLAQKGRNGRIQFTCAEIPGTSDFSFSGIKTAVLYYNNRNKEKDNFSLNKIAYSFQNSVVNVLVKKSIDACRKKKAQTLLVGGGVAANSTLRKVLMEECKKHNIDVRFPPPKLCADNAAMIAGLGYQYFTN